MSAPDLLVIACSQRKTPGLAEGPAWEIYDGALYRVLKKSFRIRPALRPAIEILIVSARYGVIAPETVITTYNEHLTPILVRARGDYWSEQLQARLGGRVFRAAHVNLGREYLRALPGLAGLLAPADVDWTAGGIGTRCAATKRWVEARGASHSEVG